MSQDLSLIWEKCLQFMRDNLNATDENDDPKKLRDSFDLFFDKVTPVSLVEFKLLLHIPSDFYREYIEENYISLLSAALRKNIGRRVQLWYQVMENRPSGSELPITQNIQGNYASVPKIQQVAPKVNKNLVNPMVAPGLKKIDVESNLIPHLSFDGFVEGESNKFASTVARSIAKRPGATAFNPLFIHGGVGVGKTHLAHAIGLEIKVNHPEKVVHYMSSEHFIQKFQAAARSQKWADFQNHFQMIDVLIVDDIQFLSGKAATQESFFHIFEYLHQNDKQIVLTSDKAPADIQDIQERVVSRFKWGLSAEIKSPDFDTRQRIIVDKLSRDGIVLTDEMVDYLAGEVNSNVRELIGIINSVIAYSTVYKSDLSLDLLKDTISKITSSQKREIDIPYIQETICDYFNIDRIQLISKSRKREIALPRQLAMYFAKEFTKSTFSKIGEEMGGKDHSTVVHACDTIRGILKLNKDKEIVKYVKELSNKIK